MTQFGVVIDGYSNTNVKAFEEATGTTVDTVLGYGSGESWDTMPPGWLYSEQFLGGTGKPANLSLPMAPDSAGVAEYAEVASGAHNGQYKAWAQEILDGQPGDGPIYIRSTWEVGGEWFPWTAVARENPEVFKAAWQQFARSFHEVSDRFQMVWDFNSDRGEVESMYPGDEAVDVIGQDIYWNPEYQGFDPSGAFEHLVNGYSRGLGWMDEFAAKHGKPMAISEWAVATGELPDAAAAAWIDKFTAWVVEQNTEGDGPGVAYMNYWNTSEAWAHGGRIEDAGPLVQDALTRMAAAIRGDGWTPAPRPTLVESEPQEPSGGEEPAPAPSPGPEGAAVSLEAGEGPDALVLKISQDAYKGAAEYVVTVDGRQVGGVFTASAAHGSGQSDTLTLRGDWGAGEHEFAVTFLNDLYEAPWDAAHDRNLHLDGATLNGKAVEGAAASLFSAETHDFVLGGGGGGTGAAPAGTGTVELGTGPDTMVLKISQDAYKGSAQYTISVDGQQVGGTQTAVALHGSGAADAVTLRGDWGAGEHEFAVTFLNDLYEAPWDAAHDRNLHLDGATLNGKAVEGAAASLFSAEAYDFVLGG